MLNDKTSKCMKQTFRNKRRNKATFIVGDLSTTLSGTYETTRKSVSLQKIWTTLLTKFTFTEWPTNSHRNILFYRNKIDQILGHKLSLNIFQRIEIIQSMLSDNIRIKLDIINIKRYLKNPHIFGN